MTTTQEIDTGDTFEIHSNGETVPYIVLKAGPKVIVAKRTGGLFPGEVDRFYREMLTRLDVHNIQGAA